MSEKTRRFRRRLRLGLILAAPTALGIFGAIWVAASHLNGSFRITIPLATILVVLGILGSLAVWAGVSARAAVAEAEARGAETGAAVERAAHRRFVARLDHELKNPVTAIRAALETEAGVGGGAGAGVSPGLEVAAGQAERLAILIGELRSLSALETSTLERSPVDVSAVVSDEVAAFTADLAARGMQRDVRVQLPSAPWPLPQVQGDADLIAVAIRNLLLNAAKYSDEGDRIEARGAEDSGAVVIEVADTGWGIAPSELPQVWDELWRGGRARRVEGSGLGLSLVRVVAELHGGDVAIRSREGAGTSVRIRIPAAPAPGPAAPPAPGSGPAPAPHPSRP